jgi:hypothetical protein
LNALSPHRPWAALLGRYVGNCSTHPLTEKRFHINGLRKECNM